METFLGWIILSILIGVWAKNKGKSFAFGFWISALLSPLIGAVATAVSKPNVAKIEEKAVASGEMKKCPHCAELIKVEASKCRYCGELLVQENPNEQNSSRTVCSNCNYTNKEYSYLCGNCGAKLK